MSVGIWLRLFMILVGLVLVGTTITSLAKRKLTESFCIAWGVVAALFILAGILLRPDMLSQYISWWGLMFIILGGCSVLAAAFFFSVRISQLNRQVQELAIQVSLLNNENAMILRKLTAGDTAEARDEEALVRN